MSNYLTIPMAAAQPGRTVSPSLASTVVTEAGVSASGVWGAPTGVTGGSALATAGFASGAHDVSPVQMTANVVIDTRPAAKLNRPPRGVPR